MMQFSQEHYEPLTVVPGTDNLVYRAVGITHNVYYIPPHVFAVPRLFDSQVTEAIGMAPRGTPPGVTCPAHPETATAIRSAMDTLRLFISDRRQEPFQPEALTLFLNNRCNLACRYCHVFTEKRDSEDGISRDAIQAAIKLVANSAARTGRPFWLVFHGGGEPTLSANEIEWALDTGEHTARASGIRLHSYLATNGVMPESVARRLGARINLVGLSCDGPADIHDAARPRADGSPSLDSVLQTGRILGETGCAYQVRTTIQRRHIPRMREIATFLCRTLDPSAIRFEPAYDPALPAQPLRREADASDALEFAKGFIAARAIAVCVSIPVISSVTRPGALYGPYCNIDRNSLNLMPGDGVTACFKVSRREDAQAAGVWIGEYDRPTRRYRMADDRIADLAERTRRAPTGCRTCFNQYHCTFGCPDACMLSAQDGFTPGGYRCLLQKHLAAQTITQEAEHLIEQGAHRFASTPVLAHASLRDPRSAEFIPLPNTGGNHHG